MAAPHQESVALPLGVRNYRVKGRDALLGQRAIDLAYTRGVDKLMSHGSLSIDSKLVWESDSDLAIRRGNTEERAQRHSYIVYRYRLSPVPIDGDTHMIFSGRVLDLKKPTNKHDEYEVPRVPIDPQKTTIEVTGIFNGNQQSLLTITGKLQLSADRRYRPVGHATLLDLDGKTAITEPARQLDAEETVLYVAGIPIESMRARPRLPAPHRR